MAEDRTRSVERLFAFTDAVVAIAITLLVLPLAEVFAEPSRTHGSSSELLLRIAHHLPQIFAFLLSFVIVARLWWAQFRVSRHIRNYTTPVVVLDLFWVLTIVVIPVTTAVIPDFDHPGLSFGLYTGTLLLNATALTGMALFAYHDPRVAPERTTATRNGLVGITATTIAMAAALVIGLVLPQVNFWALLLIACTDPFERRFTRRPVRPRRA